MFFGLGNKKIPFAVPHRGHWIEDLTFRKLLHGHESETFKFYAKKLLKHQKVADVGAHNGIFTTYFASKCNEVWAYEPDAIAYNKLVKATKNQINVRNFNVAIGATDKKMLLGGIPGSGLNSLAYGHDKNTLEVQVIRLPEGFDWVKIDVEGAELSVLEGMNKPVNCTIEFSPKNLIQVGIDPTNYIDKACSYGYRWYAIDEFGDEYQTSVSDLLSKVKGHTNLYLQPL